MKKVILTLSFVSAIAGSFAFNNSKETKIDETIQVECKRATLSCGESGVACGRTMEEVDEVIKKAEKHFCG